MLTDILTVLQKEWKDLMALQRGGGSGRGGWFTIVVVLAVFGLLMPFQFGRGWVESPVLLLFWTWVPLFLVNAVIADAVAGERERHTLETLLASRLPDAAILLGKIGAAISYGCAMTWASLLLGLVTVNLMFGQGQLLMYPAVTLIGGLVLSILGAGLSATAGVLVSLRAQTVRQAAQVMSLATFIVFFVPIFILQLVSGRQSGPSTGMIEMNVTNVLLVVTAVLAVVDAVLLAAALSRFKRTRLILE